ncbi:M56 family metallopeptidase [Leucobacter triazinivorans]|uniref:M56 family peptidase n=1 Tax=Leucobacter triazinivorans TaxID=1784719 RepID=A0A4P6KI77_9MICO|nr:M56 family metallopeptidase [Leucobacter triazinivorans]QBE49274.1 M56 family peptidase [Leucobacter triazinivorans]
MTAAFSTLLLSGVLLLAAFGGPWLLRHAAPALASAPRLAAAALSAAAMLWIAALLAIGPIVAWMSGGPAWLPASAAEVCARCLSAASPFGDSARSLGLPAILPLALPAVGAVAILVGLLQEFARVRRAQRGIGQSVRREGTPMTLLGHPVRVTRHADARAFSLPRRHGGIVLSRGAIAALSTPELAAVLEHERAHLAQRHHLGLALLNGATRYFRWVPLIRVMRSTVPQVLEIAADQSARQHTGTTALAGALLKLGAPATGAGTTAAIAHAALHAAPHAAGSERIRLLIGAPRPPASMALAAAAGAYAIMLAAAIAAVHWPYLNAVLSGC